MPEASLSNGRLPRRDLPELWVCHLGTVEYRDGLALQERVRAARQQARVPDVLLTLEHWPVYTRGRRSAPGELPMGEDWYRMQGIDVVQTDRGGKITYHGPGQLVGYPIVGVDDVVAAGSRQREDRADQDVELHVADDVEGPRALRRAGHPPTSLVSSWW